MDYLVPSLFFVWVAFLWNSYLSWRQRRVYKTSEKVPHELADVIKQETFNKSRTYSLDKSTFSLVHSLFKQIEFLVFIVLGVLPLLWNWSGNILMYFGYNTEYEVLQSLFFIWICLVYSTITSIPWTIYQVFVLEDKHGFNKQTPGFFVKDQIKGFILQFVLMSLIVSGLIFIIKWGGEYFYIYAWLFILVISLILIMTYHDFIAPCFDKYVPLPDGELREKINALADSLKFPLKKLQIVEGSKRSAHSNAYFYGFGSNKCIVLFDTLLEDDLKPEKNEETKQQQTSENDMKEEGKEADNVSKEGSEKVQGLDKGSEEVQDPSPLDKGSEEVQDPPAAEVVRKGCNIDEILAVLAHELGHWKYSHTLKNIIISEVNFFFSFFIFGFFMNQQDMFTSFGFPDSKPIIIGLLIVFELIFTPYNLVFSFLMVQLIRRFEYQADEFAQGLGKAKHLSSALIKLVQDNLSFPIADPLYSNFNHTHPTVLERVRRMNQIEKKED